MTPCRSRMSEVTVSLEKNCAKKLRHSVAKAVTVGWTPRPGFGSTCSTMVFSRGEMSTVNSFRPARISTLGGRTVQYFSLQALRDAGFPEIDRLPYSLKILLENLLRHEDGRFVKAADIEALARWDVKSSAQREISFAPARVLLQDFTGVPAVVDLAAMRDGIVAARRRSGSRQSAAAGGARDRSLGPGRLLRPAGRVSAERRARVLAQQGALRVPALGPGRLQQFPRRAARHRHRAPGEPRVPRARRDDRRIAAASTIAYPDTLVGTDSHTTMINGLGVVGWGVGGIEAEAAMLGQPISMLIPPVLGFRLTGAMLEGATATDLVLTITERLRKHGVVGKFVEFFGPGLEHLTIADRATLGNMCPEYGATIAIFPIDEMTLDYLRLTGRDESQVQLVEAYAKAQGLFRDGRRPGFDLHRDDRARSGHGRAEPRGPAAAAGSRVVEAGEERLQYGASDAAGRLGEERGAVPAGRPTCRRSAGGGRGRRSAGRRARSITARS